MVSGVISPNLGVIAEVANLAAKAPELTPAYVA